MQEDQEPASSLQAKVEPDSVAVKEKEAPVEVVGEVGWAVIEVSGAVVSVGAGAVVSVGAGGGGGGGGTMLWPRPDLTGQRKPSAIPLEMCFTLEDPFAWSPPPRRGLFPSKPADCAKAHPAPAQTSTEAATVRIRAERSDRRRPDPARILFLPIICRKVGSARPIVDRRLFTPDGCSIHTHRWAR